MRIKGIALLMATLSVSCSDRILLKDTYESPDAGRPFPDGGDRRGSWTSDAGCTNEYEWIWYNEPRHPSVIIVMDRSSAVGQAFGSATKSVVVQSALQYLLQEKGYQAAIKFGFIEYPGPTSQCGNNTCCASKQVQPSLYSYLTINNYIRCDQPSSQCPPNTADAPLHSGLLQASDAIDQYVRRNADSSQYLLIVSATEPGCAGKNSACDSAVNAAGYLTNQNIVILSVAVGWIPGDTSCLQRILQVNNSRNPQGIQRSFSPQTEKDLYSNLESVFSSISSEMCTIDLEQSIDPNRKVVVLFDGTQVPTSGADRWEFDASYTHILFKGQACDAVAKDTVRELKVAYSCSTCPGPNACTSRSYQ